MHPLEKTSIFDTLPYLKKCRRRKGLEKYNVRPLSENKVKPTQIDVADDGNADNNIHAIENSKPLLI